jgi:TatD DNase family protein
MPLTPAAAAREIVGARSPSNAATSRWQCVSITRPDGSPAAAGVSGMLIPAIRPRGWPALVELAHRHAADGVRCALGIHPQIVPDLGADELPSADDGAGDGPGDERWIDTLAERIAAAVIDAGAVAVGECGLDGGTGALALQEKIFRAHVRAARALDKPLVLHVLRAHDAAPRILREEGPVRGVLHSYSGGPALVRVYAALGLSFSFAGPVTYANARKPVEAARLVPADRLLAETDAPDQVIAGLAAARGEPVEAIAELTAANARRLFQAW